jgi:hypothetical protein
MRAEQTALFTALSGTFRHGVHAAGSYQSQLPGPLAIQARDTWRFVGRDGETTTVQYRDALLQTMLSDRPNIDSDARRAAPKPSVLK